MLQLLELVRLGDKDAIEKMIMAHVFLAFALVSRFIAKTNLGYYINDLDSAALEGIIEAVNRVSRGSMADHDNVTGYIQAYIKQYIKSAANKRKVIVTPIKKTNAKIEELAERAKDSSSTFSEFEAKDLINSLTDKPLERRILELKMLGFNDTEIGNRVNLNRLQVLRIRNKLYQRYLRKEHCDG